MNLRGETDEAREVLVRVLEILLKAPQSPKGAQGAELRRTVGLLVADFARLITTGDLGPELTACFKEATNSGARHTQFLLLVESILSEQPQSYLGVVMAKACLLYSVSQLVVIVSKMEFKSRDDVEDLLGHLKTAFDNAKDFAADYMDNSGYLIIVQLAASISRHLAETARPLPRLVDYVLPRSLPALAVSQRIYADGSRSDELVDENKVVHPAFVRPTIRALSA